jgi:hypothetical protein
MSMSRIALALLFACSVIFTGLCFGISGSAD